MGNEPTDSLLGRNIDEYRLISLLGRGGMARVYLGLDTRLKRYVAIKIVDTPFRGQVEYRERFRREAQAVAQLDHPHIVHLYHYGESDDLLYMVMQYIEGANLAYLIYSYQQEGDRMPAPEAGRIIREMGQALDFAHRQGVIHRDIKPSNIMLDKDGRAILTDFGLALLVETGSQTEVFGTPHYMAPEQVASSAAAGPASDLYSLGVILYEMLTGEVPFEAENPMDVALMQVNETPRPPRAIRPEISPAVEAVILQAMAKEPAERYPNGAALADALDAALSQLPPAAPSALTIPQRVTQVFEREVRPLLPAAVAQPNWSPPAEEAPPPAAAPAAPPPPDRRPWLYAGGGLIGLLFICLALFLLASWINRPANGRADFTELTPTPATIAPAAGTAVAGNPTPTIAPTATPTATPEPTPTPSHTPIPPPAPQPVYQLLLAKNRDDALFVVNQSGRPFPLPPLWLSDGRGQVNGQEWGVPTLASGACVTMWKDSGRPDPPDIGCNEVGERLTRGGRERFWDRDFEVYYDGQKVGDCPRNQAQCVIAISP